jgi:hypothetical protein
MINPYFLSKGQHASADAGRCAMEWVSYLAGEPHSDSPQCVSPVLTGFCIRFNDRLNDTDRQQLRPYLARTIGTRDDGRDEERFQMCREFLLRRALPLYLDAAGRDQAAAYLRSLPTVLTAEATLGAIRFARGEARDARCQAEARLADRLHAELAKRGSTAIDAAIDAATAAATATAAIDATAIAGAATAAAATAAVADAAAATAAATAAAASLALRGELRRVIRDKAIERVQAFNQELKPAAFELLDRMLPTEVIALPVVADAELVCAVPSA